MQADDFPWFKALHGDCSVTELFLFLMSTCGFLTAAVGLSKAEGKISWRSGKSVGSSSQLTPEWDGVITQHMG